MRRFLPIFVLFLMNAGTLLARSYTTTFPATENPISESGNWINGSANGGGRWDNVQTTGGNPGVAENTAVQSTSGGHSYGDATAILTGTWGPTQTACGTVYINAGWGNRNNGTHEVEIRLRSAITSNSNTGYEINYSLETDGNRYAQIVRWNGPGGSFTGIGSTLPPALASGDVICAKMSGSTITLTRNGATLLTATDSTFGSGAPGMGLWNNYAVADNTQYGFSKFTADDGTTSTTSPPSNLTAIVH